MNWLEIIVIVTGVVFMIFSFDLYQRKRFTLLHFLIFSSWIFCIMMFSRFPILLERFGRLFWLARWADLIVYLAIIFLGYGYIEQVNKWIYRDQRSTRLSRSIAINTAVWSLRDQKIVCTIPAFGEDDTAIKSIKSVLNKWYWVVVIDDGNNKVVFEKELKEELLGGKVVIIKHPFNLWQWAALQTWSEWILRQSPNTEYVVHFDADGQHDIRDIDAFINAFVENPQLDIVLWSRTLWKTVWMPKTRSLHKKLQVLFMRLFVWLKVTDTNNGFRMIKKTVLEKLVITSNWMTHASELESMIFEQNLQYTEVPVTIYYTDYSLKKWQKLSNSFSILGELFYKWWFYK